MKITVICRDRRHPNATPKVHAFQGRPDPSGDAHSLWDLGAPAKVVLRCPLCFQNFQASDHPRLAGILARLQHNGTRQVTLHALQRLYVDRRSMVPQGDLL